ncbi:MAG: ABC transporter permease [Promethearchaeota archaeon]
MKLRHYIRANFKDKRFRNILCVVGIVVGMILFMAVNLFSLSYESLIFKAFSPLEDYNQIVQRGTSFSRMLPYNSVINESVYDELEINASFDALDIYPVYFKRTDEYSNNKSLNTNIVFGLPYADMAEFFINLKLANGTWAQHENHTVIGYDLVYEYKFEIGDLLLVKGKNYTISGILEQQLSLFDWFIMVDLGEAQTLFSMENILTSIFIRYEKSLEDSLQSTIESTHLDLEYLTLEEINELSGSLLSITQKTSIVFMILTLFCSTLFTTSIVFLNVHDRKREIATLRSIGAPRSAIFSIIYGEVLIIALIALIGVPIGISLYSFLKFKFLNITSFLSETLSQAFIRTIASITWKNALLFMVMHFGSSLIMAGIPYYLVMKNDIQSEIRGN